MHGATKRHNDVLRSGSGYQRVGSTVVCSLSPTEYQAQRPVRKNPLDDLLVFR
jgi:hypothetical protein